MTKTKWLLLAIASSIASLGLHLYLTLHFYEVQLGISGDSLCNLGSSFNCDAVTLSRFSQIWGIPVAAFGFAAHAILLLTLGIWWLGLSSQRERILRFAFWIASLVLLASFVMGGISVIFLQTYCLFCLLTYLFSIALFIGMYASVPLVRAEFFSDLNDLVLVNRAWLLVLLMIPGLGWITHLAMQKHYGVGQLALIAEEALLGWKAEFPHAFDSSKGLLDVSSLGIPDGTKPMEIVEFADYLCPHCKVAAQSLNSFLQTRAGTQLLFKSFPLDGNCNDSGVPKGDGLRCELAYFVHCAEKTSSKGNLAKKKIFEGQEGWNLSTWSADRLRLVSDLGLDETAVQSCMTDPTTRQAILEQAAEGSRAGIRGTPAIFVNGRSLQRGQMVPVLERVRGFLVSEK